MRTARQSKSKDTGETEGLVVLARVGQPALRLRAQLISDRQIVSARQEILFVRLWALAAGGHAVSVRLPDAAGLNEDCMRGEALGDLADWVEDCCRRIAELPEGEVGPVVPERIFAAVVGLLDMRAWRRDFLWLAAEAMDNWFPAPPPGPAGPLSRAGSIARMVP